MLITVNQQARPGGLPASGSALRRLASLLVLSWLCAVFTVDRAAGADIGRFVVLNACPIVERLEIIEATGRPGDMDRFIIVSIEGSGQSYVQCLFLDDGASMLCEASSGRYGPPEGEPGHLKLMPAALSSLADLGFDTDAQEGNYQLFTGIGGADAFERLAVVILSALYRGYGASTLTPVRVFAPLAFEIDPAGSGCAPVG